MEARQPLYAHLVAMCSERAAPLPQRTVTEFFDTSLQEALRFRDVDVLDAVDTFSVKVNHRHDNTDGFKITRFGASQVRIC